MPARFKFLRDAWRLIKPYWTSEERFTAWLLLGAVIALTLAMVYMNVLFNDWYNSFYNALQEKDKASFWKGPYYPEWCLPTDQLDVWGFGSFASFPRCRLRVRFTPANRHRRLD